MSAVKNTVFSGRRWALSITAAYLLVSGIWIYVSNYVLLTQFQNNGIRTVGDFEAIEDTGVALLTAVLIYLFIRYSFGRLERSERELKDQTVRLQTLSHQLIQVQENERRAIAQELHDEIGQALTGLKLSLEMLERRSPELLPESVKGAVSLSNDLISRVRHLSLNLRPVALDDLGLVPALLWHFERYSGQTGVQVDFRHQDLDGRRFAQGIETAAYRIIQEALTNVARHAGTNMVEVRTWVDQSVLHLHIEDHGIGLDANVPGRMRSSGLVGMHERASSLGGVLSIDSQPGRGTRLVAELPLSPEGKR
jgi:signal transduction histidine kinase